MLNAVDFGGLLATRKGGSMNRSADKGNRMTPIDRRRIAMRSDKTDEARHDGYGDDTNK